MTARACLWCKDPLPNVSVPSHGESLVICPGCRAGYTPQLLIAVPRQTWQLIVQRQGWTVERADGSNMVWLTEL